MEVPVAGVCDGRGLRLWHVNNGGPLASGYGIPNVVPGADSLLSVRL